jgi:hypothetical protein
LWALQEETSRSKHLLFACKTAVRNHGSGFKTHGGLAAIFYKSPKMKVAAVDAERGLHILPIEVYGACNFTAKIQSTPMNLASKSSASQCITSRASTIFL